VCQTLPLGFKGPRIQGVKESRELLKTLEP
jgi:hypothetical protein